jgi:hypothetical protein
MLTGMLRIKPVSHFVEQYRDAVSYASIVDDLISNKFCELSK